MYSGSVGGRLVEKFNRVRESEIRIVGAESGERREARFALDANTVFDKDSGSASGVQQREVAAVGEKCDLAGGGVVHAGDAGDFGVAITFKCHPRYLASNMCNRLKIRTLLFLPDTNVSKSMKT